MTFFTESEHHICCNRHSFQPETTYPVCARAVLITEVSLVFSGVIANRKMLFAFRSGASADRSLTFVRSWRHCPAAFLLRSGELMSSASSIQLCLSIGEDLYSTPKQMFCQHFAEKYFSKNFCPCFRRFIAPVCRPKVKASVYPFRITTRLTCRSTPSTAVIICAHADADIPFVFRMNDTHGNVGIFGTADIRPVSRAVAEA